MDSLFDVAVIGGGPAGSVAARSIAAAGYSVALFEKQPFPRETVCGEFLSLEVTDTVRRLGLETEFHALRPNPLTTVSFYAGKGRAIRTPLGFTAYGVKRGKFDAMLLSAAEASGVTIQQPAEVTAIERSGDGFAVRYLKGSVDHAVQTRWVVGAWGKRSPLDKHLSRAFSGIRTGYTGVKFHVPAEELGEIRREEIVLAFGPGIYCGVNNVGDETGTVCFLVKRRTGDTRVREGVGELARINPGFACVIPPHLLEILRESTPYGTSELYFGSRSAVENGVMMVGDAAGIIAPLAGDGIGIAMEQALLLGMLFAEGRHKSLSSGVLLENYTKESARLFSARKRVALFFQRTAMSSVVGPLLAPLLSSSPSLVNAIIRGTRGRPDRYYTPVFASASS